MRAMKTFSSRFLLFLVITEKLTIEFVNVAGMATVIHQPRHSRKSFPLPRTKLLTNLPSSSATYRLNMVLRTKKTVWLTSSRSSLLRHPGITIFSSRSKFRRNSRFSSTFFRGKVPPLPPPLPLLPSPFMLLVPGRPRISACRCEAAFCSAIALWTRFTRARKSVR